MNTSDRMHMPKLVCGRGSISFVRALGKKRVAVIGYSDTVMQLAEKIFKGTDTAVRYIATIHHEPLIRDIFDNLDCVREFEPDMILAIGGGSVMDVAKGLLLFYEHPDLPFEDSLIPFALPPLGKKAMLIAVPTTSGTGSETSSAAVFVDEKTQIKNLLLANTLIPHYAILDADFTDALPASVQTATGLDALCHAMESCVSKNSNSFTKSLATQAALDIMEFLPEAVREDVPGSKRMQAKEFLHNAATMSGISITNSFTGIVHAYDHPGPAFDIPHGVVCGIMLPYSMKLVGPTEEYARISRRLGYKGDTVSLTEQLISHLFTLNKELGLAACFQDMGVDEKAYFEKVPEWAERSLSAVATQMSLADMDKEKGMQFYTMCYYGIL